MNGVVSAAVLGLPAAVVIGVAALIAWGGPTDPQPLESIRAAVAGRDRSHLPPAVVWRARDGTSMVYRHYTGAPAGQPVQRVAVLIHGSVGSGREMHEVATTLSAAGWTCIVPDLRGHGASGTRGDIAYVGQLEDDFADLVALLDRQFPLAGRVLLGHSSGGGLALRLSGLAAAKRFDGLVLLAPFLAVDAPTTRPQGGWASVGVGRLLGLQVAGALGIHSFDHLPVLSFAVAPEVASSLTPHYSYRLMQNFGPHRNWRRDISQLSLPAVVLVGRRDELFYADRFEEVFAGKAKVRVLDDIDHMGITGDIVALQAVLAAVAP